MLTLLFLTFLQRPEIWSLCCWESLIATLTFALCGRCVTVTQPSPLTVSHQPPLALDIKSLSTKPELKSSSLSSSSCSGTMYSLIRYIVCRRPSQAIHISFCTPSHNYNLHNKGRTDDVDNPEVTMGIWIALVHTNWTRLCTPRRSTHTSVRHCLLPKFATGSWYAFKCNLILSLTPCSTAVLEKLTGSQPVKKFPAFYGTRRFITAFISDRHLSLSLASSIQSIPPHPTSWRSILILSSHLRLGLRSIIFPSYYYYYYYLLTPCTTALLEKLTVSQPVKKFLALYGTRRFITEFTCPYHEPDQSSSSLTCPLLEDKF